jgi:hypothetical protein
MYHGNRITPNFPGNEKELAKYFYTFKWKRSNVEGEIIPGFPEQELPALFFWTISIVDRHLDAANGCLLARL